MNQSLGTVHFLFRGRSGWVRWDWWYLGTVIRKLYDLLSLPVVVTQLPSKINFGGDDSPLQNKLLFVRSLSKNFARLPHLLWVRLGSPSPLKSHCFGMPTPHPNPTSPFYPTKDERSLKLIFNTWHQTYESLKFYKLLRKSFLIYLSSETWGRIDEIIAKMCPKIQLNRKITTFLRYYPLLVLFKNDHKASLT